MRASKITLRVFVNLLKKNKREGRGPALSKETQAYLKKLTDFQKRSEQSKFLVKGGHVDVRA